jgi:hypothetical protein
MLAVKRPVGGMTVRLSGQVSTSSRSLVPSQVRRMSMAIGKSPLVAI